MYLKERIGRFFRLCRLQLFIKYLLSHLNKSLESRTSMVWSAAFALCEGHSCTPLAGRGRGEPYVISHSVAEAVGSRGTGRKSNSCSAVQHGYSWMITSGSTGQPITGPVCLSAPLPLPRQTLTFTVCVLRPVMDIISNSQLILPFTVVAVGGNAQV